MRRFSHVFLLLIAILAAGCAHQPLVVPALSADRCDAKQAAISRDADARAGTWDIERHLARNFQDGHVSWLMRECDYQRFIVETRARFFGRCDGTCYLLAAPTAVVKAAVRVSMRGDHHDAAALGTALGLPARNFEGELRMMTLDLRAARVCARLPVESDPGVFACATPEDHDCFKFGGYTSGGIPEVMIINAPVADTAVERVP